jgi:hypothetical protein
MPTLGFDQACETVDVIYDCELPVIVISIVIVTGDTYIVIAKKPRCFQRLRQARAGSKQTTWNPSTQTSPPSLYSKPLVPLRRSSESSPPTSTAHSFHLSHIYDQLQTICHYISFSKPFLLSPLYSPTISSSSSFRSPPTMQPQLQNQRNYPMIPREQMMTRRPDR